MDTNYETNIEINVFINGIRNKQIHFNGYYIN